MKTLIYSITIVALLFVSCSKSDDDNTPSTSTTSYLLKMESLGDYQLMVESNKLIHAYWDTPNVGYKTKAHTNSVSFVSSTQVVDTIKIRTYSTYAQLSSGIKIGYNKDTAVLKFTLKSAGTSGGNTLYKADTIKARIVLTKTSMSVKKL